VESFLYFNGNGSVRAMSIYGCKSTLLCGPALHYSVDLRTQTYTEPVALKYGKFPTNTRIFLQCSVRIVTLVVTSQSLMCSVDVIVPYDRRRLLLSTRRSSSSSSSISVLRRWSLHPLWSATAFFVAFHIFVVGKRRDFKFDTQLDSIGSPSPSTGNRP